MPTASTSSMERKIPTVRENQEAVIQMFPSEKRIARYPCEKQN